MNRIRSRRFTYGLTLVELLMVLALVGFLALGLGGLLYKNGRGQRYRDLQAIELICKEINQARQQARLGINEQDVRSVNFAGLKLPTGVEYVTSVSPSLLPSGISVFPASTPLVFEPQSGRTAGDVSGMVIVRDPVTQTARGVVIPSIPGPLRRFVQYGAQQSFEPMTNAVY